MSLHNNPERMWFGTEQKMGWIETPNTGADVSSLGMTAEDNLLGGGGYVRNSWDSHKVFQFSWGESASPQMASLLQSYRNGSYGRGLLYFHDPMHYHTNLLPKRWADPSMAVNFEAEPLIPDVWPTAVPVTSTANNYPIFAAQYAVPSGYSSQANNTEHFIPIPTGMVLILGAVCTPSAGATLYIRTPAGITDMVPMDPAAATVVNTVIRDQPWARLGIRNTPGAGTLTITGISARLADSVPEGEGSPFSFTNIMTHGSFEVAGAPLTVRTNGVANPRPTTNVGYQTGGGTQSFGPDGLIITTGVTVTTPYIFSPGRAGGATLGRIYALSAKVRATPDPGASPLPTNILMRPHKNTGNAYYTPDGGIQTVPIDGTQYEVQMYWTATVDIPESEVFNLTAVGNGVAQNGFTLSMTDVLIEEVPVKPPTFPTFFYGDYSPDPDLTPSWTGTVGNSPSILTGLSLSTYATPGNVALGIQSSAMPDSNKALRQIPVWPTQGSAYTDIANNVTPRGMLPGQTWTIAIKFFQRAPQGFTTPLSRSVALVGTTGGYNLTAQADDIAGTQTVRLTFVIPPTGAWYLRLYNGGRYGDPSVWWDEGTIVAGEYNGPTFNGNDAFATWVGTPNASNSLWTGNSAVSGDTGLGPWYSGEGHSGCRFVGTPTVINYSGVDGGRLGLSALFKEVGAWE